MRKHNYLNYRKIRHFDDCEKGMWRLNRRVQFSARARRSRARNKSENIFNARVGSTAANRIDIHEVEINSGYREPAASRRSSLQINRYSKIAVFHRIPLFHLLYLTHTLSLSFSLFRPRRSTRAIRTVIHFTIVEIADKRMRSKEIPLSL